MRGLIILENGGKFVNFVMADVQIVNTVKRPRKPNFSPAECTTILKMAEENLTVIREKFSNTITNQRKKEVWKTIADKVNSLGVAKRTVTEVKDKWRSMVMGAKKEFALEKRSRNKTGGGKESTPPSGNSERIINLFGDEPSFSGISGGIESGAGNALAIFEGK